VLTQADVERELERLVHEADTCAHDIAQRAEAAGRAEHAYKVAHAKAMLRAEGAMALREAQALLAVEDQHLARKIADAHLMATQEKARTIRAQLDALRSVNATVRHAVGGDW